MENYYNEDYIKHLDEKCSKIQKKFNFKIPRYVLEEILDMNEYYNKNRLCIFINWAVINGRITKEEGKILKEEFIL